MDNNAWMKYLADNYKTLQGLCYFSNKEGSKVFCEDAWNEVLDRLQRLFVTYDPEKGNIDMYIKGSLNWYIYKAYVKRTKRIVCSVGGLEDLVAIADMVSGEKSLQHYVKKNKSAHVQLELALAFKEAVFILLEKLTKYEYYIYIHSTLYGYTYTELGEAVGVARTTIFADIVKVRIKVKEIAATYMKDSVPVEELVDTLVTAVGCT